MRSESDGLLLIDKERGKTSFDVIRELKRISPIEKAGHTGTLDKFAEGLLLLLTGRFTRLVPLFASLDKVYRAVIRFGERTDTLDIYGRVVERGDIPVFEKVEIAVKNFIGEIDQIPPLFSAVHVNGRRAYKYALEDRRVDLRPKRVTIYTFDIVRYDPPDLEVLVKVSKGTYVRAIARDLGRMVDSCAHLRFLRRECVGQFNLSEAKRVNEVDFSRDVISPYKFLRRLESVGYLTANDAEIEKLRRGIEPRRIFNERLFEEKRFHCVFNRKRKLVAVFEKLNSKVKYVAVFN